MKKLVRIIEPNKKHLLCKFNPLTNQIEFVAQSRGNSEPKITWAIDIDKLKDLDESVLVEAHPVLCPSCKRYWRESRRERGSCLACGYFWKERFDLEMGTSKTKKVFTKR